MIGYSLEDEGKCWRCDYQHVTGPSKGRKNEGVTVEDILMRFVIDHSFG